MAWETTTTEGVMDDDRMKTEGEQGTVREQGATPGKAPRRPRRKWPLVVFGALAVPVALLAAWTAVTLNVTYSRGDRAGYIQKFSDKGWICKTWEGQLAMVNVPGANQERFDFSVRDDSVAAQITKLMGSRVAITYEQHRGVPGTCFGETEYFVTGVKPVQ
jgi:hypothetical protein